MDCLNIKFWVIFGAGGKCNSSWRLGSLFPSDITNTCCWFELVSEPVDIRPLGFLGISCFIYKFLESKANQQVLEGLRVNG